MCLTRLLEQTRQERVCIASTRIAWAASKGANVLFHSNSISFKVFSVLFFATKACRQRIMPCSESMLSFLSLEILYRGSAIDNICHRQQPGQLLLCPILNWKSILGYHTTSAYPLAHHQQIPLYSSSNTLRTTGWLTVSHAWLPFTRQFNSHYLWGWNLQILSAFFVEETTKELMVWRLNSSQRTLVLYNANQLLYSLFSLIYHLRL